MTISKPDLLSAVKQGRFMTKKHFWRSAEIALLSEWARCQKAVGGIYSTRKWRAEYNQQSGEARFVL
jgi:hypothetical protein